MNIPGGSDTGYDDFNQFMTDIPADHPATTRLQNLSVVVALACLIYGMLVKPPANLSQEGMLALAVLGFGLVLWQSKAIPHVATSILVVGFLYAFGVVESFEEATIGFASTLFFFFFAILVLGHSISKVGLDTRIARRLLARSSTSKTSLRQLGKYVLVLSFIMPSALARMVTFTPVINEVQDLYGLHDDNSFLTSSFLVLGQLNPVASMSLMTGGGLSIIGAQLIQTAGYPIDWVDWAVYMIPPTILIYVLGFLAVEQLNPLPPFKDQLIDNRTDVTYNREPLTRDQRIIVIVMSGTLLAWIIGSFIEVPTVLPAIVAVALLSAPYVRVLTADDLTMVNWGVLFLIGSILSLIDALETTGAFDWLIGGVSQVIPFDAFSVVTIVAVLLAFTVVMRLLFPSGSTCVVVTMPIVISFGSTYNLNIMYLSLSTILLIGATVLLPLHVPPALLGYNRGYIEIRDVFRYGLVILIFAIVSICFAWLVYWPLLELIVY